MILIIVILVIVFGFGGWHSYNNYGPAWGGGIGIGGLLIIILLIYLLGNGRLGYL